MLKFIKALLASAGEKEAQKPAEPVEAALEWVDKSVPIGSFDRIKVDGLGWVEWSKGAPSMTAKIDAKIADGLAVKIEGGVLSIVVADGGKQPARIKVTSGSLVGFECKGMAGGVAAGIDADVFEASLDQGPRLLLDGKCVAAKLSLAGSGSLQAEGLWAHSVRVKVEGPGSLDAKAESMAEVSIGGGGEAVVFGNPPISKVERTGPGRAQVGHKVAPSGPVDESGIFGQMPLPRQ